MQYDFAKSLHSLMGEYNTQLHALYKKSAEIQKLDAVVKKHLDVDLAKHCHVANLNQSALIIAAENASWGTRLRYAIPELLSKLRSENHAGQTILVFRRLWIDSGSH